jgi:hypothetical protein
MREPFRRLSAVLVLAAQPAALLAQDGHAGQVRKVTDPAGREVSYPTQLAEVTSATAITRAIVPDAPVASGEAVLTKGALTHVRMAPGQPEAVLYANTLVRFDAINRWLLRSGAAFIVNRRGKLAVVVEGLETLLVGSEVYVERTDAGLLAYVVEGSVSVGAAGVVLGPGQAARAAPGGAARRTELRSAEHARVVRQIELARGVMGGPIVDRRDDVDSHGAAVAWGALGLGAAGAGVYLLTREDAQPDLVPVPIVGDAVCAQDSQQRLIVRVINRGEAGAPASSARLSSARGGTATLPTPAFAPRETVQLLVPNPALCSCPAVLTIDAGGQVAESDETNNELQFPCRIGAR